MPEKCDVDMTRYGDPNPPYVVMRRADGWLQRWKQVRLGDYPASLRSTNLMLRYPLWEIRDQGQTRFPADQVRRLSRPGQAGDSGFVQSPIPHDWESWNYPHKLRDGWGCAEKYRKFVPDPGPPQSPVQPSQDVPLEVLETRVYEPQWIAEINASDPSRDWNVIAAHDAECRSFLKSAGYASDRPDLRGWLLFVKDPTGNKKARNAGALLCDAESLWFVDYYQPEDRRHLGASEGGGVQIERSMKVRLREPAPAGPSN